MIITTAQYVADVYSGDNACIKACIDGQDVHVPLYPSNRHYAEIMRQVEAGTLTIQEAT